MIGVEDPKEFLKDCPETFTFNLTIIYLLVLLLIQTSGVVEHVPGFKELVVPDDIDVLIIKLKDCITVFHILYMEDYSY